MEIKKFLLGNLLLFPIVNLIIGSSIGMFDGDTPAKIVFRLLIGTLCYIIPLYLLLKSRIKS